MKIRLILFFIITMLFLSCKRTSQNAGEIGARVHLKKQASQYKVPVEVTVIRRGPIHKEITIYGKILPKEVTLLSTQFSGRISGLSFSQGDRVRKNQIAFLVQTPKAEALQQVLSKNPSAKKRLSPELVPISIRIPFNGVVTKKFHYSGDVVSAGEPILEIQDDSVFYLWGQLPAVYLPDVKIGQKLKITFPDLPQTVLESKIEAINSAVDRLNQMAQIRALLPNSEHLFKSGLFARIDIIVRSLKNALLVPRNAVLSRESDFFVFLKKNGKAHLQPVEFCLKNPSFFAVASGLTAGDSVIVLGNYELKDGMAVEVIH